MISNSAGRADSAGLLFLGSGFKAKAMSFLHKIYPRFISFRIFFEYLFLLISVWLLASTLIAATGPVRNADTIIYPWDGLLPKSSFDFLSLFSVYQQTNGGLVSPLQGIVHFYTAVIGEALGLLLSVADLNSTATIQYLSMGLAIAVGFVVAYAGFSLLFFLTSPALSARPSSLPASKKVYVLLITAFYIVSPPVLVWMSYGVFWSVSEALCVGFIPVGLGSFLYILVKDNDADLQPFQWALGLSLGVMTIGLLLALPMGVLLICYGSVYFGQIRVRWKRLLLPLAIAFFISLPTLLSLFLVASPGYGFSADYLTTNAAYGNIRGGPLTPLIERSAWPLYNLWEPRLVLNFHEHFYSGLYLVLMTSIIALSIVICIVNRNRFCLAAIFSLAIFVFLAKAASPPFGFLFPFLIEELPVFQLIRTPDTKVSLFIHFAYTLVLLSAYHHRQPRIVLFTVFLCSAFVLYNLMPIRSGQATLAKADREGGYAISLTEGEKHVLSVFSASPPWTRVLLLPASYGKQTMRTTGLFGHREPLQMLSDTLFFQTGMPELTAPFVSGHLGSLADGDLSALKSLGINYLVKRSDPLSLDENVEYVELIDFAKRHLVAIVDADDITMWRYQPPLNSPIGIDQMPPVHVMDSMTGLGIYIFSMQLDERVPVHLRTTIGFNAHWRLIELDDSDFGLWRSYLKALKILITRPNDTIKPIKTEPLGFNLYGAHSGEQKTFVLMFWPVSVMILLLLTSTTVLCYGMAFCFLRLLGGRL